MKKTVRPVRKKKVQPRAQSNDAMAKRIDVLERQLSRLKKTRAVVTCDVPNRVGWSGGSNQCGCVAEFEMPLGRGGLAYICRKHACEMDAAMKPFGFYGVFRIEFTRLGSGEKVTF